MKCIFVKWKFRVGCNNRLFNLFMNFGSENTNEWKSVFKSNNEIKIQL